MAEERPASPPTIGALRDAIRTTIAFVLAWGLTKIVGAETAANMSGAVEAVVVIITSALFAGLGKIMRNRGNIVGEVV